MWRRPALLTPSHPCRGWYAKESSEEWEGSVESLGISAQKEAPSLSVGGRIYLCSCASGLVRGANLGAQDLTMDTPGTMEVEVCSLLLPLGEGKDLVLTPRSSQSTEPI